MDVNLIMGGGKGSKFIKQQPYNPVVLGRKINQNRQMIEQNEAVNKQKYRALEDFVGLLINFASHDIKNAVHTMDGMLSTITLENLTISDIEGLKISMDNIREVMDNFGKFNLEKKQSSFPISQLFRSLEILHRPELRISKTAFMVTYNDMSEDLLLHHDFHPLIQLFNNLMINSLTALHIAPEKKIKIQISPFNESNIQVTLADSGTGIEEKDKGQIFTPYFTTKKNGTGVGLSHAKYVMKEFKGEIELINENEPGFSTTFRIIIPIK